LVYNKEMEHVTTVAEADLEQYAKAVVEHISNLSIDGATVLALQGNLGAGKTTFTKTLSRVLGVTEVVTSPTFVVMKRYKVEHANFDTLVHIDAYRIESESEMTPLRFAEVLNEPRTLVCLEWPEKISGLLPTTYHLLSFAVVDEKMRTITYEQKTNT